MIIVKTGRFLFCFMMLLLAELMVPARMFAGNDYEKHLTEMKIDDAGKVIIVFMDDEFAQQEFTEKSVRKINRTVTKDVHKALPREYRDYTVKVYTRGVSIESLLHHTKQDDEQTRKKIHRGGWWGDVAYDGRPWVTNVSRPNTVTAALNGKHISLWASHGRFYKNIRNMWEWQRPNLFCTTEDLFTQTIVVPFLIPMLENAGANVFTPRERDWQTDEVIVDNDKPASGYREYAQGARWCNADSPGFAVPDSLIPDNYNPFEKGTVRQVRTSKDEECSKAVYQPAFAKSGRYAVYVSYATVEKSVDDALYTVWHQGMRTDFRVNQQMGGGTWVYLGTFDFDMGSTAENRVEVSSCSHKKGVVTTDAVRFGGGMGNIVRGEQHSGMPRCLEGARYYAQWAGLPYDTLSLYKGEDDYKDDINVRSLMTNWLAGGSPYAPNKKGKNVPIDLSLAVHSDAGFNKDMTSIFGSLAVCTTDFNEGKLDAGAERSHSKDFAQKLLDNTKKDLTAKYGAWNWRDLYDRNYSETRLPAMPSAIFETLSHQSFPDMRLAHDPTFKFTMARSVYKTILQFEAEAHGEKAVISPLAPQDFRIAFDSLGNARLQWAPQYDQLESSALPTSYNVYMAIGGRGFDNGTNVPVSSHTVSMMPDLIYRFRVTAVNDGGESLPSEELAVVWHGPQAKNILIVNGFQRLAGPQVIDNDSIKGFDLYSDPGVSYGMTAGWCGNQQVYDITSADFGRSGSEMEGCFVAGNNFNYVSEHAMAMLSASSYNITSATRSAVEQGMVSLAGYDAVDLILGNERNDGYSLLPYKTFTASMQRCLRDYVYGRATSVSGRHALLVSGSYIASDMQADNERQFLSDVLHTSFQNTVQSVNNYVTGLQQTIVLTNTLNPEHYATTRSDVLAPASGNAFISMQYSDGQTAAVANRGYTPTFVMGFPFECISNSGQRAYTMRGILSFLLEGK